jgi:predicted amidohydrolase
MKDIITFATINFHTAWAKKEENLDRIKGYITAAAKRGADFIVFPEMALTGYDDEPEKDKKDKMQMREAELISGPSSEEVGEVTKKYGVYAVFGMPELDPMDANTVYNSVAICGPEGVIGSYRKMHLPFPEMHWATKGDKPCVIPTEWGPIGLSICYDTYQFPELMRYEAAKGCRVHINCTAIARCHGSAQGKATLEASCIANEIYIVSSNIVGVDKYNDFWGGSSIIGPSCSNIMDLHYYAGYPLASDKGREGDMFIATIDLTYAKRSIFKNNPLTDNTPDWSPKKYINMFNNVLEDKNFGY